MLRLTLDLMFSGYNRPTAGYRNLVAGVRAGDGKESAVSPSTS